MSLLSLRDAIASTLRQSINGFAEVDTHGGRFDIDEIKRWAKKTPCCIVGPLGVNDFKYEGGQMVAMMEWGAFIIAKDQKDLTRHDLALVLLESMIYMINPTQRFKDDAAHAPESILASNLYNGTLDSQGLSLWAVTWVQGYDVRVFDPGELDDFLRYRATMNLNPDNASTPRPQDAVDLSPTEEPTP